MSHLPLQPPPVINLVSLSRQDRVDAMIGHLASLSDQRLIVSFAPYTPALSVLKRIGELFPGPSKVCCCVCMGEGARGEEEGKEEGRYPIYVFPRPSEVYGEGDRGGKARRGGGLPSCLHPLNFVGYLTCTFCRPLVPTSTRRLTWRRRWHATGSRWVRGSLFPAVTPLLLPYIGR